MAYLAAAAEGDIAKRQQKGNVMSKVPITDHAGRAIEAYYRSKKNQYSPFQRPGVPLFHYDLRLKKDGVIANIINKTIVSIEGTDDPVIADSIVKELETFGFRQRM